jgi:hypothetical protein
MLVLGLRVKLIVHPVFSVKENNKEMIIVIFVLLRAFSKLLLSS